MRQERQDGHGRSCQVPDFVRSTYDVRRLAEAQTFKVYEIGGEEVDGCES